MALIIAVLVGVLAANAYGGQSDQGLKGAPSAPRPGAPAAVPEQAETAPAGGPQPADGDHSTDGDQPTDGAQPTSGAASTPASPGPATPPKQPSQAEVVNVVTRYFSLLPKHLDESWELLGPGLRAQGQETYQHWWNSVDEVKVLGRPKMAGSTVQVNLMYRSGGKLQVERHVLGMVVGQDGKPLINSDDRRGR